MLHARHVAEQGLYCIRSEMMTHQNTVENMALDQKQIRDISNPRVPQLN